MLVCNIIFNVLYFNFILVAGIEPIEDKSDYYRCYVCHLHASKSTHHFCPGYDSVDDQSRILSDMTNTMANQEVKLELAKFILGDFNTFVPINEELPEFEWEWTEFGKRMIESINDKRFGKITKSDIATFKAISNLQVIEVKGRFIRLNWSQRILRFIDPKVVGKFLEWMRNEESEEEPLVWTDLAPLLKKNHHQTHQHLSRAVFFFYDNQEINDEDLVFVDFTENQKRIKTIVTLKEDKSPAELYWTTTAGYLALDHNPNTIVALVKSLPQLNPGVDQTRDFIDYRFSTANLQPADPAKKTHPVHQYDIDSFVDAVKGKVFFDGRLIGIDFKEFVGSKILSCSVYQIALKLTQLVLLSPPTLIKSTNIPSGLISILALEPRELDEFRYAHQKYGASFENKPKQVKRFRNNYYEDANWLWADLLRNVLYKLTPWTESNTKSPLAKQLRYLIQNPQASDVAIKLADLVTVGANKPLNQRFMNLFLNQQLPCGEFNSSMG